MTCQFPNDTPSFPDILKMSVKLETERLDRELKEVMMDEYMVDEELMQKLDDMVYEFPDVSQVKTDKRALTRTQNWFSAKIHIKRTPLYFHRHEFIEILYMYKGTCRQYIENLNTCIVLKEGDFFFINQNVIHALSQEDDDSILIKIIVPISWISYEFVQTIDHRSEWFNFFINAKSEKREYYHYIHVHQSSEDEKRFVENMMTEFYCQKCNYTEATKNYLQLLLINMSRGEREIDNCRYKLTYSSLQAGSVIQYIYDHCDSVTLEKLSEKFSFNQSYLSRMIKENCKVGFRDLLKEIRIEKSIVLLSGSDYSIEKIALMVGYRNAVPIYKEIKKKFGISPSEYRRLYSKNNIDVSTNQ